MKARIKATGKIIEVISRWVTSISGYEALKYIDQKTGVSYFEDELCFPKDLTDDPDYWTRLEHQYAGMALQGLMAHTNIDYDEIVDLCVEFAHTLVEKMKEE